jgi:hypothetical protein
MKPDGVRKRILLPGLADYKGFSGLAATTQVEVRISMIPPYRPEKDWMRSVPTSLDSDRRLINRVVTHISKESGMIGGSNVHAGYIAGASLMERHAHLDGVRQLCYFVGLLDQVR